MAYVSHGSIYCLIRTQRRKRRLEECKDSETITRVNGKANVKRLSVYYVIQNWSWLLSMKLWEIREKGNEDKENHWALIQERPWTIQWDWRYKLPIKLMNQISAEYKHFLTSSHYQTSWNNILYLFPPSPPTHSSGPCSSSWSFQGYSWFNCHSLASSCITFPWNVTSLKLPSLLLSWNAFIDVFLK